MGPRHEYTKRFNISKDYDPPTEFCNTHNNIHYSIYMINDYFTSFCIVIHVESHYLLIPSTQIYKKLTQSAELNQSTIFNTKLNGVYDGR